MSDFFENVSNGQEWRPEPFRRYNAVNALLSEFGPTGAGRGNRATENRTVYSAINRGTETIHAGTAVEPSGGDLENDQLVPVKQSAAKTTALWGVSMSDLEPGDIGQVLLTGIVTIPLAVALPADTAYVAPGTDGKFEAATGSRAQVIATKDTSAIINIGGGAAAEATADGEPDVVVCEVKGGTAQTGYTVTMFADGPDQPATGEGLLYITELAFDSTLPVGSRVLGHRVMIQATGRA